MHVRRIKILHYGDAGFLLSRIKKAATYIANNYTDESDLLPPSFIK